MTRCELLRQTHCDVDDGFLCEEPVDYLPLQALKVVVGAFCSILTHHMIHVGHCNGQEVLFRGAVNDMGRLDFTGADTSCIKSNSKGHSAHNSKVFKTGGSVSVDEVPVWSAYQSEPTHIQI